VTNVSVEARTVSPSGSGILSWTEVIEDPREPLSAIRVLVDENIAKRFSSRTDPWGGSWAPPSITTIEIRLARGQDPIADVRFPNSSRFTRGGRSLNIGFGRNQIPRFFAEGNPANRVFGKAAGPVPARPVLPITASGVQLPTAFRAEIMDAFRDQIREAVRRAGRGESEG